MRADEQTGSTHIRILLAGITKSVFSSGPRFRSLLVNGECPTATFAGNDQAAAGVYGSA
jgi:DNA-binding LacI/PurR family transcriptional regulator